MGPTGEPAVELSDYAEFTSYTAEKRKEEAKIEEEIQALIAALSDCLCGNPVEMNSGAKSTFEEDIAIKAGNTSFGIKRNHRTTQESGWSLGKGWHANFWVELLSIP